MKLKIRTVAVIEVQNWDDLVIATYSKPYCFQQQDGCKERGNTSLVVPDEPEDFENDTVPEEVNHEDMGVSFAAWLARDSNLKIPQEEPYFGNDFTNMWWERNFYPNVQMVANDLHEKGLLDAGKYEISIDW